MKREFLKQQRKKIAQLQAPMRLSADFLAETLWPGPSEMNLEDIMLRGISQTEKNKYHMISLICGIWKKKKRKKKKLNS